jgi:DNA-binding beta-propeller fold protein YncE
MNATLNKSIQILLLGCTLALFAGCAADSRTTDTARAYSLWPPFPQEPRSLFLASYSANTDVEPAKTKMDQLLFGATPQTQVPIGNPYGVAMWNGRIYICDTRNPAVEILDLRKHDMELMSANEAGKLAKPIAIAIAPDGTKYIADGTLGTIAVFDASDHYVRQIGHENFRPVGVAVHGDLLYATDFKANHVEVFNRLTGDSLRIIGEPGTKKGQMVGPLGIATDAQGNVYVDDIVNCRVQKFSPDGKVLGVFGALGDHPGTFTRPKHIAVDNEGVIYVVDAAFQNVQMFDNKYQALLFFGNPGDYAGSMDLPAGITLHEGDLDLFADRIPPAFQAEYLVLVTNQFGLHKVSVYAMGHLKPGRTVNDLSATNAVVSQGTTTQPATGVGAPLPDQAQ